MRSNKEGNIALILIAIGAIVLVFVGVGGYVYLNSQKTSPAQTVSVVNPSINTQTPTSSQIPISQTTVTQLPTQAPSRKFSTIEEALSFALTGSGMENADSTKVRGIKVIYTSTMKSWTFDFTSRTNPHPSLKTGATVYDEPWQTVKVTGDGQFSVSEGIVAKDQEQDDNWSYLAKPSEAAISTYFDLAKQRVAAAGLTTGTIIYATFSSLGLKQDTDGYNNEWDINVVLAGEEGNSQKKAKKVVIKNGAVRTISDSIVTLY